jgi:hypothetical protein
MSLTAREKAEAQKAFRDSQREKGYKSRQYWVPEGSVGQVDDLVIELATAHRDKLKNDVIEAEEELEVDDLI